MKHLNYLLAFLMTLIWGTGVAKADVVNNYKMDFNTQIDVSSHDFKVASGWGHIPESYYDDEDWDTYWVSYSYSTTTGVDNSGALKCGSQQLGSSYSYSKQDVYDLLVTPKITGTSSIYVKKYSYSSASISFYKVTVDANGALKKGDKIDVTVPTLTTSEYVKVDIPAVDGEYIGIRGSNVYIDDFTAEQAEYELSKSLKVTAVSKVNSGYSVDCNAEGKFPIALKTTVSNNGDLAISPGDENYSLSVIESKSKEVIGTSDIEIALEPGASADVEFTVYADYETYKGYKGYQVKENITGTVSSSTQWFEPTPYEPLMEVRTSSNDKVAASDVFAYGMIQEATSKEFTIRNTGAAPLTVTAITVPDGFSTDVTAPITIDAHGESKFNLTLNATATGVFSGNVTVSGTNVDDIVFGVSGTVLDPAKFYVDFEDQQLPAGSYAESVWKIAQRDYASGSNVYLLTSGTQNSEEKFVTPLLRVAEGEKMTVDVARTYYNTAGDGVYLKVYYSTNRRDWTLAREIKSTELSSKRAVSYTYSFGELTSFVIDNIPAGDYYIGFAAGYTCIDNIYGFEKVSVAHDLVIKDLKIPAKGMVNNQYTATVSYNNLNATAEAADSYEVSLYVNDVKVATSAVAPEMASAATLPFELTMVPHEVGTFPAYIEFKSIADGFTVKSEVVDVTIGEEKASQDIVVGEASASDYNVPFYFFNADNILGADCDILYTADMLKAFGLKAGQKITSVTYTGTPLTSKDYNTLNLYACVGAVDEATYEASEKEDGMQKVEFFKDAAFSFKTSEPFVTKIDLTEPIVWDGVQGIRVRTHAQSNTYVKVNYDYDTNYKNAYYKKSSASSFSNTYTPVAVFGISADPAVVSGKVVCGETPVANATVKLTSGDVYYTATTAEDGTYTMNVFQTDKQYVVTATAEDYDDYAEAEPVDVSAGLVKDITLVSSYVKAAGQVLYRNAPLAGVKVTLSTKDKDEVLEATSGEDGKYQFDKVRHDVDYYLSATCDKFIDYAVAEPLNLKADYEIPAINMDKQKVMVVGTVKEGEEPLANVEVAYSSKNPYAATGTVTTDADGKFSVELPQDANYIFSFETPGYEAYTVSDSIMVGEEGYDFGVVQLKPLMVAITMPESGYMAYSSDKPLDFSVCEGMKAYVVTAVKLKNDAAYVELAEVAKVPAMTGVILVAPAGEYSARQILEADNVEKNLLVATADEAYKATADEMNTVWTLGKTDADKVAFTTGAEIEVPQGSAYLRFAAEVPYIYWDEADVPELDGINGVAANGVLDLNAPMYNLAGQKVGKEYKGVVIQNGKKFSKK